MNAVKLENITKAFPGVLANDNITIEIKQNTIHCLLGENGSGKTTLMNILFGLYKMDSGQIYINEEPVVINKPTDAQKLGIGMVHQHFMLLNQYTIWENVILGHEPGQVVYNRKQAKQEVQDIIDKYNFNLDINMKVRDLSVGMKQRVEIVKLIYRSANIIIFDEPTAVLTPQEVVELFEIFQSLISKGCTIIFITHKLSEIFAVSDNVSVLRKGIHVGDAKTGDLNANTLAEMMVGKQIKAIKLEEKVIEDDPLLRVENLAIKGKDKTVSFTLNKGEILGVAGIDGNGQMELEEMITGVRPITHGEIYFEEELLNKKSVKHRKELGFGYIPSERGKNGILPKIAIKENFLLGYQDTKRYRKGGFIRQKALEKDVNELVEQYSIRLGSTTDPIGSLSGGNQQKVVLAREASKEIKFLLAAQPIRGLDIGATNHIHQTIAELRMENCGVLLISAEISELLAMSDRIIVLHGGEITGEFNRDEFDEFKIGLAMLGEVNENGNEHEHETETETNNA